MRKRFHILLTALLLTAVLALPAASGKAETAAQNGELRFADDGTFTVLVLSDLQDTQYPSPYLNRAMSCLLDTYPVDLVVLLGNQLDGESFVLRVGNAYENVKTAITRLLEPLHQRSLPFVVIPGGHDYDAPVSVKRQLELYRESQMCILPETTQSGAYRLPVYHSADDEVLLNLYLFASEGAAGTVSDEQVAWYNETSAALRAENGNLPTPSVAFMHTIVPEAYELFEAAAKGEPGAVQGEGSGTGGYYLLDSDRVFTGEVQQAPSASMENSGLFDSFLGNDDVFLAVSGNDPGNSFIASLRGVDLASVPSGTYTGENSEQNRGVRLFRFNETNVKDYETILVPFSDFGTAQGIGALHYYLTTTTRISNAVKVIAATVLTVTALAVLLYLILKPDRRISDTEYPDEANEKPEDPYL